MALTADYSNTITGSNNDDRISGTSANDVVFAGAGSDTVSGGNGEDHLIGDSVAEMVFKTDLVTAAEDGELTVTFDFEGAGYRNTIGIYKVSEDGSFGSVELLWANASLAGSGGDLIGGESKVNYDVLAGEKVGFFLISNGFSQNNFDKLGAGSFKFVDAKGKPGTVDSVGSTLVHVAENGKTTVINGSVYHTAAFGDRAKLNADGLEHTMGYKQGNDGTFQIGFEDLYNGGDRDFDDAVITVDIGQAGIEVLNQHYDTVLKPATEGVYVASSSYMAAVAGNDRLSGNDGADWLEGMEGNDLLAGGGAGAEWQMVNGRWVYNPNAQASGNGVQDESDDLLDGGTGNDVLLGGRGDDTLSGGEGQDTLNAGRGDDVAYGGAGNDLINLEDGNDTGYGGTGADTINAGDGDDVVYGGEGNDALRGGTGNDRLMGEDGADEIFGGAGADLADGGAGADKLFGNDGDDLLVGGGGNDTLDGGADNDELYAGEGADLLLGGDGNDRLNGGDGDDKLVGGQGQDFLEGGAGNDNLWGGSWAADGAEDVFIFTEGCGRDMIQDFEAGTDRIDVSAFDFEFSDIMTRAVDLGWAVELGLGNGDTTDCVIIKSLSVADMTEDMFIM